MAIDIADWLDFVVFSTGCRLQDTYSACPQLTYTVD